MFYTTHLKFSKIIYNNLHFSSDFKLKKYSFNYGNIMPDLILNFKITPHNFHSSADYIINKINELIEDTNSIEDLSSKSFAIRLGVINHYLADFFCWPHNKNLIKKKFIKHMQYEQRLNNIAKKIITRRLKKYFYLNLLSFNDNRSIKDMIYITYEDYKNQRRGILTDILFAIKTCILIDNYIIKECQNNKIKKAA